MIANLATLPLGHDAERVALRLDDATVSYGLLEEGAARVAGLLRGLGVGPGDRVGVMLPNVPQFALAYYGVLRLGGVVVPMSVLLKEREVAFHVRDSGARVLLAWPGGAEAAKAGAELVLVEPGAFERRLAGTEPVREVAARAEEDTAVILYTSGTTGTPKGAELTHANLWRNARVAGALVDTAPGDVALGALPLVHSFGQTCALNATLASGATLTLLSRFDPARALEIMGRDRVSIFQGVPTVYGAMLHLPDRERYDTSSLRVCVSGGASMPGELLRGFEAAFSCTILEGYGLSETSPVASFNRPDRERKVGSIGTPIAGVQMRLADVTDGVGEIVIRGHNVMKGYWRQPDATRAVLEAGGWLHTGDLARVDEDGYFFIVDRQKELIIRGGYNVYPREVEEVLYEHPAVREAAVIGVPDARLGEEVGAAVALKDGADASADELREFARARVAAYKYPRLVWFVGELPKGPTGEILKREITTP